MVLLDSRVNAELKKTLCRAPITKDLGVNTPEQRMFCTMIVQSAQLNMLLDSFGQQTCPSSHKNKSTRFEENRSKQWSLSGATSYVNTVFQKHSKWVLATRNGAHFMIMGLPIMVMVKSSHGNSLMILLDILFKVY